MRVIAKKVLRDFWVKHANSEQALKSWFLEASKAEWKNAHEVKEEYPKASVLKNGRVVFDIVGGKYWLIVRINYQYQMVWIRFIGTHKEYDQVNVDTI